MTSTCSHSSDHQCLGGIWFHWQRNDVEDSKKLQNPKEDSAIVAIYSCNNSRIRLGVTLTWRFPNYNRWSKKCCSLLIIIVLGNVLLQASPNHGINTHLPPSDADLPDLDFIDNNIAKESAADEHLQNLQDKAATVGLNINNHKAKILLVNYHSVTKR